MNHPSVVVYVLIERAGRQGDRLPEHGRRAGRTLPRRRRTTRCTSGTHARLHRERRLRLRSLGRHLRPASLLGLVLQLLPQLLHDALSVDVLAHGRRAADDDDGEHRQLHRRRTAASTSSRTPSSPTRSSTGPATRRTASSRRARSRIRRGWAGRRSRSSVARASRIRTSPGSRRSRSSSSNWHGITRFDDMKPKPLGAQYERVVPAGAAELGELWTPQVYAGSTITPVAHVVNDDEQGADHEAAQGALLARRFDGRRAAARRHAVRRREVLRGEERAGQHQASRRPADGPLHAVGHSGAAATSSLSTNETPCSSPSATTRRRSARWRARIKLFDPSGASKRALDRTRCEDDSRQQRGRTRSRARPLRPRRRRMDAGVREQHPLPCRSS